MNNLSDIAASDIITVCNSNNNNNNNNYSKLVCLTRGRECEGENSMVEWQNE